MMGIGSWWDKPPLYCRVLSPMPVWGLCYPAVWISSERIDHFFPLTHTEKPQQSQTSNMAQTSFSSELLLSSIKKGRKEAALYSQPSQSSMRNCQQEKSICKAWMAKKKDFYTCQLPRGHIYRDLKSSYVTAEIAVCWQTFFFCLMC